MKKLFEKAMYLETAEVFDQILKTQTKTYGALEIRWISRLIKENKIKTVLDIGTGEGSFLLNLAKKLKDVCFTGIDHNDDFLKRAEKLKSEMGISNVKFTKAFFDPKFSKGMYDMIFARFTLQHVSQPLTSVPRISVEDGL